MEHHNLPPGTLPTPLPCIFIYFHQLTLFSFVVLRLLSSSFIFFCLLLSSFILGFRFQDKQSDMWWWCSNTNVGYGGGKGYWWGWSGGDGKKEGERRGEEREAGREDKVES